MDNHLQKQQNQSRYCLKHFIKVNPKLITDLIAKCEAVKPSKR